jgi:hypothetical protein
MEIIQILLRISTWIHKIQNAIEDHSKSRHDAQIEERNREMPTEPIKVILSLDEQTRREAKAESDRQHETQNSIKIATWLAVVAAGLYALTSLFVWCAMIVQNRTANAQLRQSTESFRIDERAWVEIEPVKPVLLTPEDSQFGATFTCNIYPKNVGKTVARDISVNAHDLLSAEGFDSSADTVRSTQNNLLLGKNKEMGSGKPFTLPTNPVPSVLAPNNVSPVPFRLTCEAPKNHGVHYLIGRVDYCDQFNIKHWLTFCFYVVNARGEIWTCQNGNDEDRNDETPTPATTCGKPS